MEEASELKLQYMQRLKGLKNMTLTQTQFTWIHKNCHAWLYNKYAPKFAILDKNTALNSFNLTQTKACSLCAD